MYSSKMKELVFTILISLLFCGAVYGQTQFEMNNAACKSMKKTEEQMQSVLKLINLLYKDDPKFIKKLRISQEVWSKFLEAQLDAKYPHKDEADYYGSVFPMGYYAVRESLIRERTKQLMAWIEGVEEGECCGGSVMFKHQLAERMKKLKVDLKKIKGI